VLIALVVLAVAGAAFFLAGGPALLAPAPTSTPIPPTATQAVATEAQPPTTEVTAGPVMAPVCAPGVVPEVAVPQVTEHNQYCVNKRAVTELRITSGATFVSQRSGYQCDSKTAEGGQQIVACFGPENLTKFDIQVCIPIPTPSTSAVVGQCGEGTEYDYDNACCAPPKPENAGCILYNVSLRGCG
jgi:hypothetical protein